ncbi:MAG TPA: 5-(carboxyamino)imidazole ribonucleotide synthase [Trichocoleus sp.]|jgi:5-(carboxyamino)imidazole ribonucleotide synthase
MVQRVGVIGGGQLAWMMATAAQKLNIELIIQTPYPTDPAVSIATHTVFAPIADATATAELAAHCDAITFENEFVDLEALLKLEDQGVQFYPSLRSLVPLLDKYEQRCYLRDRGLPTPEFTALTEIPYPAHFPIVLKARRHGYDGQGTFVVKSQDDLAQILTALPDWLKGYWLQEEFVPFERELAVMAARSRSGEIVVYPVVETQQENQVCQRVLVTQDIDQAVVHQVETIAQTLLDRLSYVGIMGIEFFLNKAGQVLVNETAPRTHNSGHYSLDACVTSQFEQQLRAVCGLPLGNPALTAPAVMVNLLGYETAETDYSEKRQKLAQIPNGHLYWYGKSQARPGRKLGHVTVLLSADADRSQALKTAQTIESIWYPQ